MSLQNIIKPGITRFLSYFIIAIFASSCGECVTLKFDANETFWVDPYDEGDTIVFALTGDSLKRDTIFITRKTHYTPDGQCNMMVSNYDCEGYFVSAAFRHDTSLDTGVYFIQYTKTVDLIPPVLRVFNLEYSRGKIRDTSVTLNTGEQFDDCMLIPREACTYIYPETDFRIKEMLWSKSAGLILYVGEAGEKYELQRNN